MIVGVGTFIRKIMKHGIESVKYELSEDIRKDISRFVEKLQEKRNIISDTKSDSNAEELSRYENNEDDIVSCIKEQYVFRFDTGKTYNTWLVDRCPKVRLLADETKLKSFFIQVAYEKRVDNAVEGHQEGIYIRTNKSMFTFGVDYQETFRFDYVGKYTIEACKHKRNGIRYRLYIILENNMISYGAIEDGEYGQYGKKEFLASVIEVGIFCKTWEKCSHYEIAFDEVKLKTDI